MARQQALSILRGLGGFGGGRGGGLGNVSAMPSVGGMGGGGGLGRGGGQDPAVRSPNSGDLLTDQRSALSHGDDLLKGYLQEWFPTPQQKNARKQEGLLVEALLGTEQQPGIATDPALTREGLGQTLGGLRERGADPQTIFAALGYGDQRVGALSQAEQAAREWEWKLKILEENLRLQQARTANTQAAGARAAAKAAGGGGASAGDYF